MVNNCIISVLVRIHCTFHCYDNKTELYTIDRSDSVSVRHRSSIWRSEILATRLRNADRNRCVNSVLSRIEVTGTKRIRVAKEGYAADRGKNGRGREEKATGVIPGRSSRNPRDDNRFARPVPRPFALLSFFPARSLGRRIHSLSSNPSVSRAIHPPC